ncbi:MAG: YIP1 family protein, partial [Myxococcota bacterium]
MVPHDTDESRCPHCGHVAEGVPEADASPGGASPADVEASTPPSAAGPVLTPPKGFRDGSPAWEQTERSFYARVFGTAADVFAKPRAFFAHLSPDADHDATGFAFLCLLLGTVGQAAWSLLSLPVVRHAFAAVAETATSAAGAAQAEEQAGELGFLEELVRTSGTLAAQLDQLEAHLWATLLLAPLTAYCTLHLLAGMVHLSLHSFRPLPLPAPSYDQTYRHLAYAFAPQLLGVLPAIGGFAGLWSFALMVLAMRRLHQVRLLGLVGGVLFPVLMLSWLW